MDMYNKKVVGGLQFSRNGSSIAPLDSHEDRSIQYCTHLGHSTRPISLVGNPGKLKESRAPFFSTGRKATVGSSSGAMSTLNGKRKPQKERQSTSSLQESDSRQQQMEDLECNIRQETMINLELDPISSGIQTVFPEPEVPQSSNYKEFPLTANEASRTCQVTSNSRTRRTRYPMTRYGSQGASSSSSIRYSFGPREATHMFRPSLSHDNSAYRYGLRNLSCTSISDVLPSSCSSDIGRNEKMDASRKMHNDGGSSSRSSGRIRSLTGGNPYSGESSPRNNGTIRFLTVGNTDSGESSSARSKGAIRSTVENPDSPASGSFGQSPSILQCPLPQPTSRRTRNWLSSRDGIVSARNQRVANRDSRRTRPSAPVDDNTFLLPETVMFASPSRAQISFNEASSASSSQSFSANLASISGQSSSISGSTRIRRGAESENNIIRSFQRSWVHRDGYQCFNMDGIAEVLLALERIEQNEVLTYEELMILESNLFVDGIGFHDQHRDMRMDIDNMSYEELLVLEEQMGTVSTALTEEALSACLKRSIYTPTLKAGISCVDDDVKCSICQEEYIVGDEIGELHCNHRYHVTCIHQWLQQKNWCPICKSSACPS